MRLRDQRLRSGRLLAWFHPVDRRSNGALLFLVRGAGDIQPLTRIQETCCRLLDTRVLDGFEWHQVSDVGQLANVDPALLPSRLTRVEVAELAMLNAAELEGLLGPALERLAADKSQLFPTAGAAVGTPAEGIQFLGREREIRRAVERLAAGRSLEILAPRRSGKSSLLRRLGAELPPGWRPVALNLEKEFTPEDLAARLWVTAAAGSYRAAQRRTESGWEPVLAAALQRLAEGCEVLALLLDELVFFLRNLTPGEEEGARAAAEILGALDRGCRGPGVRLVIANSVPLGEYLDEMLGLPESRRPELFRSLEALRLPPLEAPALELRRLLLGTGLVPEADDIGWLQGNVDLALPYPALRFLDFLAAHLHASGGPVDGEVLERLLVEFLDTTDAFAEFESNLRRYGSQQSGGLTALRFCLDRLTDAAAGAAVPRASVESCFADLARPADLFAQMLDTFPVVETEEGVALASRLFRRWWRRQLEDGDGGGS